MSRSPTELKAQIEAERAGAPFLVWREDAQRIRTLEDGRLTIGRDAGCDIALGDDEVSRLHAGLERVGAHWVLADHEPQDPERRRRGRLSDVVATWVSDVETNLLTKFDSVDGRKLAQVRMPLDPEGIAVDGDILWVACGSGVVQRVSSKSGRKVGGEIDTGPLTGQIDALLGVAWAAGPDYLVRIQNREAATAG